ncbi:MAG: Uncharacterized protein G01um101413_726 [Parcubacteria group bacterium Gr01-1014_13]|nr:MAG: Uncharacterized protein G01um101413_726 [Parcubacteria group bacterium Gr01-1014_13]
MKEPTYRQTLSHAWDVVWHNKSLWVLGLFSVLLGQFGFSDIFGKIWSMTDVSASGQWNFLWPTFKLNWSGDIWSTLGVVWLVGIFLSLVIFFIFLAVTSQGALISYAADWFKSKKHQKLSKPWGRSLKHFWSIFLINVIRKVLLVLSLAVFGVTLNYFIFSQNLPQGFVLALSLVVILFLSLFISIISIYTLCSLVIDGKGVRAATAKAWNIFSEHTLVSLEVGFLLMLLNCLLVIAIAVGAFFAFLPAILFWLAAGITNTLVLASLGFGLGVFLWLVFIVIIAGFFNAYTTSAWVFLFMKMHKEGIASRLIHFFKHMFSK